MTYQDYLKSEHWSLLRGAKLQISPKCEMCRSKEEIEVHHKCYRASWYDAKLADLQTLCHDCHVTHHVVAESPEKQRQLERLKRAQEPKRWTDWVEPGKKRIFRKNNPPEPKTYNPRHHLRLMS